MKYQLLIITLGLLAAASLGFGLGVYHGGRWAVERVRQEAQEAVDDTVDAAKDYGLDKAKALRDKYLKPKE